MGAMKSSLYVFDHLLGTRVNFHGIIPYIKLFSSAYPIDAIIIIIFFLSLIGSLATRFQHGGQNRQRVEQLRFDTQQKE